MLPLTLAVLLTACNSGGGDEFAGLQNNTDSVSYAIGLDIGNNMSKFGAEINERAIYQALKDVKEEKVQMTDEQSRAVIAKWQIELRNKQQSEKDGKVTENLKAGADFLAANSSKEGVVQHESGLQYKVLTPGTGASPLVSDKVQIHYRGTLLNGTEFDSSYKREQPAVFDLAGLIQGWQIALPMMKEGGKWEIYVPGNLAYGERGFGNSIGPNETLIFQIELFKVNPE